MSYKPYQLDLWKTAQISSMNHSITGTAPVSSWPVSAQLNAMTVTTSAINQITCSRSVSSDLIKKGLLSTNTYITMKYINILADQTQESQFNIPSMIDSGTISTSADDFRNLFVYDNTILPEVSATCFTFTASSDTNDYSVSANENFNTLNNSITSIPSTELALWNDLPNKIKVQDKTLYISLRKPNFKYFPLYDPPPEASDKLLNGMHLKEALKSSPLSADFLTLFPEITQ